MKVGYGGGVGADPFTFDIPSGQDVDVGYFKIILSTLPVNLSHLAQPSPFYKDTSEDVVQVTDDEYMRAARPSSLPQSSYSVIHIPVITRRGRT